MQNPRRAALRKGYKCRPTVPVRPHALERIRQRWPDTAHLYDTELRFLLSDQILDALHRRDAVIAPGGLYVPISIFGQDAYAVLLDQEVRTVLPSAWCNEVEQLRRKSI
jgi:hypothetical protein